MKFETTRSFEADYKKLSEGEKRLFRDAIGKFNEACDEALAGGGSFRWPKSLRVKNVEAAPGVWEMTWSFSGPDGRATWEWITIDAGGKKAAAIRWRRIGNHAIFGDP